MNYDLSQKTRFEHPDAEQIFLNNIGLTSQYLPLKTYSNNQDRMKHQSLTDHFMALHYVKYRICESVGDSDFWHNMYIALRNRLVSANIALVHSLITKSPVTNLDYDTMFSEGCDALISSADNYNPWRGTRFSTYACRAILHRFNAASYRTMRHQGHADITEIDAPDTLPDTNMELYIERMNNALEQAELDELEKDILSRRFGKEKMTLKEVGEIHGKCTERIRQIQMQALRKIKIWMISDSILK